jgi:dienelactone hydrolase
VGATVVVAAWPLQIHMMDADEWVKEDLLVARDLVDQIEHAELFLYPGDGHLFADSSLSDFDQEQRRCSRSAFSPSWKPSDSVASSGVL